MWHWTDLFRRYHLFSYSITVLGHHFLTALWIWRHASISETRINVILYLESFLENIKLRIFSLRRTSGLVCRFGYFFLNVRWFGGVRCIFPWVWRLANRSFYFSLWSATGIGIGVATAGGNEGDQWALFWLVVYENSLWFFWEGG